MIKIMVKYIILLIIFTRCNFIDEPIYSIDPIFEPYYLLFLEEAEARGFDYSGRDIIVYMAPLSHRGYNAVEIGRDFDNVIEIVIGSEFWKKTNPIGQYAELRLSKRERVLFHEFGHGLLRRGHVEDCFSIMDNTAKCVFNYTKHRKEMLDELFR